MTHWVRNLGVATLGLIALSSAGLASTQTGSLAVSASVAATCSITPNAIDFGAYTGAQADASSTLSITCTNSTGYTVSLDAGGGTGASIATRKMMSSSNTLNYSLYLDSNRSQVFGTAGGQTYAGTGNGSSQSVTFYGRIPSGQTPVPGSYADTVTATITY